jgi:hypothetical protein
MSTLLTIITWILAIAWFVMCIFWDEVRWHWPFLPRSIGNQIREGEKLLGAPCGSIEEWQFNCRGIIERCWGRRSEQMKQFNESAQPPDDVSDNFQYGKLDILREQVRTLKKLKAV